MNQSKIKITHEAFRLQIIDLAHVFGWKVRNVRPARTKYGWCTPENADGKGFPDLYMVKPPRVVIAELKVPPDKCKPEQESWLELLAEVPGHEVYIWAPDDFDKITEILRFGKEN
jgi:hypothetical protein